MDLLAFKIERDVEAGVLVASWDDPEGGGITTQADNLTELAEAIKEQRSSLQLLFVYDLDPLMDHLTGKPVDRDV